MTAFELASYHPSNAGDVNFLRFGNACLMEKNFVTGFD